MSDFRDSDLRFPLPEAHTNTARCNGDYYHHPSTISVSRNRRAVESLLSAVVADGMAGTKHDSNQELIGQGVANIFAPLSGGFAATGAIARTATNIRNGATSSLAGIAHAMFLILVVLFLVPLARRFPCAVCRQSCLWWRGI